MVKERILKVQLNVAIPLDLADGLDVFCEKRNVSKKALVELALRRILAEEGTEPHEPMHDV